MWDTLYNSNCKQIHHSPQAHDQTQQSAWLGLINSNQTGHSNIKFKSNKQICDANFFANGLSFIDHFKRAHS